MDDGTPIELRVTIDEEKGSAVFDFEGTGPEVLGNASVTSSIHLQWKRLLRLYCGMSVQHAYLGNIQRYHLLLACHGEHGGRSASESTSPLFLTCGRVNRQIPLNQGCLVPITVKIPPHCLLDPNPTAAVVGKCTQWGLAIPGRLIISWHIRRQRDDISAYHRCRVEGLRGLRSFTRGVSNRYVVDSTTNPS